MTRETSALRQLDLSLAQYLKNRQAIDLALEYYKEAPSSITAHDIHLKMRAARIQWYLIERMYRLSHQRGRDLLAASKIYPVSKELQSYLIEKNRGVKFPAPYSNCELPLGI